MNDNKEYLKAVAEIRLLEEKTDELHQKIQSIEDGFKYTVIIHCYNNKEILHPKNHFILNDYVNYYNGDNGVFDVITTNPEIRLGGHPGLNDLRIITEEEYNTTFKG